MASSKICREEMHHCLVSIVPHRIRLTLHLINIVLYLIVFPPRDEQKRASLTTRTISIPFNLTPNDKTDLGYKVEHPNFFRIKLNRHCQLPETFEDIKIHDIQRFFPSGVERPLRKASPGSAGGGLRLTRDPARHTYPTRCHVLPSHTGIKKKKAREKTFGENNVGKKNVEENDMQEILCEDNVQENDVQEIYVCENNVQEKNRAGKKPCEEK